MNLDNFLLTSEEATNLANDLIQQQTYKSGENLLEPIVVAGVRLSEHMAVMPMAVAVITVIIVFIQVWVRVYGYDI